MMFTKFLKQNFVHPRNWNLFQLFYAYFLGVIICVLGTNVIIEFLRNI